MDDVYYVYEDDSHELYYYCLRTQETTYEKPENKTFLDPETNEPYVFLNDVQPEPEKEKAEDKSKAEDIPAKPQSDQRTESDQETSKAETKAKRQSKSSETESDKDQEGSHKRQKRKHKKHSDLEESDEENKQKHRSRGKHKRLSELEAEPDSDSNDNKVVYFVYKDQNDNYYYYNTTTNESTYEKPENAKFLDPETNQPYVFDGEEVNVEKENPSEQSKEEQKQPNETLENQQEAEDKTEAVQEEKTKKSTESSESDPSSNENAVTYFVYHAKKRIYFYNTVTQETTYDFPQNAKFLDPETKKPYVFTEEELNEKKKKEENHTPKNAKHARFAAPIEDSPVAKARSDTLPMKKSSKERKLHASTVNLDMVIDVPREVTKFKYIPESQKRDRKSFFPDADKLALPANLQQDIHNFQVDEYAKQFFKEHRTHHFFSRKKISPEVLASFQDSPLTGSLLSTIPKNSQKESIQCFNLILNYTGATKDKVKNTSLDSLLQIVDRNPILRDEVYFQLIKQTNNNPRDDVLLKTWEIFVVMATIFPSSLDSEVWIKSHLSREAMKERKTISDYAQFAYIRFCARCTVGKPMDPLPMFANRISKDVYESKQVFRASIYEQLWNQRTTHKLFPVPIFVHAMAEMLLQKGAETTEGIFRIVGNKRTVISAQDKINKGAELDPKMSIHDLASLFKSWFSSLPDTLIPVAQIPDLINASEDNSYLQFAEKLPKAHLYTLKYLIGFFQRLVKSKDVTKMDGHNLAICFGPDIISTGHVKDISDFEKFRDISIKLVTSLIENFVTKDVYPLVLDV